MWDACEPWEGRWASSLSRAFGLGSKGEEDTGYHKGSGEMGKSNCRILCSLPEAALKKAA